MGDVHFLYILGVGYPFLIFRVLEQTLASQGNGPTATTTTPTSDPLEAVDEAQDMSDEVNVEAEEAETTASPRGPPLVWMRIWMWGAISVGHIVVF